MPLYEYQCESCANRFERIQKFSDPPVDTCPTCGGAVKKLLSSPAIQFKGSGWYITDYARKSKADDSGAKSQGSSSDSSASSTSGGDSGSSAAPAPAATSTKPDKS
jgi:putative FmdB family regulatory protein